MEDLLGSVFHTIEEYHMIGPGMRVIAGVSGGADSICLLQALRQYRQELPFELLVVHVEHGLRGQESLDDAAFVKNLCAGWEIPCRVETADVHRRADEESLTVEEAARAERYRIFEEVGEAWNADRIAVAHNRNDQAETVLWNLTRGSSLKGLGGIRPVQGKLIRPLLFTERTAIEAYLENAGLTWRTDRTNLETEYTRNRIRLSLLPQMEKELNTKAGQHIAEAADRLREVQEYIDKRTDEAAARCIVTGCEKERENTGQQARAGTSFVIIRLEAYKKEERLIRQELLKRAIEMCAEELPESTPVLTLESTPTPASALTPALTLESTPVLISEWNRAAAGMPADDWKSTLGKKNGLKDVGAVHIHMLEKLADMDCGKRCDLPGGIYAVRENGILRFRKCGPSGEMLGEPYAEILDGPSGKMFGELSAEISGGLSGEKFGGASDKIFCAESGGISVTAELMPNTPELKKYFLEEKKYTKWISYDTIKSNLLLRTRRSGDYLVVNAGGGTKKLKDYLIDQKIPRDMRDRLLLLADGSHILWVIGWRLSEAAKVTDETRQVLKVTCSGLEVSAG